MNILTYIDREYKIARMRAVLFSSINRKAQSSTDQKFNNDVSKLHGVMEMMRSALSERLKCGPNEITVERFQEYDFELTITPKKNKLDTLRSKL